MTEAPKRIWATEDAENYGEDSFHSTTPFKSGSEYILTAERDRIVAEKDAEIARLTAERDAIAALTVERCAEAYARHPLIRIDQWYGTNWRHRVHDAIRALSPIPPHVAAARVLLAETEAGKDPEIGAWLRALMNQETP